MSCFVSTSTEYLGLWVNKYGLRPLLYKINFIDYVDTPTKLHDVRQILVCVNYYQDMWYKCAHTLAPPKQLCHNKVNLKWNYYQLN